MPAEPRIPWDRAAAAPPSAPPPRVTWRARLRRARLAARPGVDVAPTVALGRGVRVEVAPGARLRLGAGCVVHDGVRLHVRGGTLEIGPGAVLGDRCAVVVAERVTLGERCRLGDGAVVVDQRPCHADPERPTREQGMWTLPVTVGHDARIGAGAVLEAGAAVPPLTAVAAHRVLAPAVAA